MTDFEGVLKVLHNLREGHVVRRCLDCGQIVYGEHNANHTYSKQIEIPINQWENLVVEVEKLQRELQELIDNSGRMIDFDKEPCVIIQYRKLKDLGCVETEKP